MMEAVNVCKLIITGILFMSIKPAAAQLGCHIGSPSCNSQNPNTAALFPACCKTFTPRQRQDSFRSGDACIRCATLGCHVDKNCASETGDEVASYEDCCAMRNRRSFRNPNDGTCQLCNNCYKNKNCRGNNAVYADTWKECCAQFEQGSYNDPDTENATLAQVEYGEILTSLSHFYQRNYCVIPSKDILAWLST
ncbi:uncharacterized protein [Dysidea avara]|uniref:uncharacterized protein n=1 Tax=Dysidea avara TaxID=196820 RepID=UPI00331982F8